MKKNNSLKYTCHRTGDKVVATGTEGADGVCVLMIYCSGAAYLPSIGKASTTFVVKPLAQTALPGEMFEYLHNNEGSCKYLGSKRNSLGM